MMLERIRTEGRNYEVMRSRLKGEANPPASAFATPKFRFAERRRAHAKVQLGFGVTSPLMYLFMSPIIIIIILSIVGVIGDFYLKLAGNGPKFINIKSFVIGLIIYALTAFGWFYVMKHIKLSSLGVIYSLSMIILLVFLGVFYFHERLNVYEVVGIIIALISILLLSRFA